MSKMNRTSKLLSGKDVINLKNSSLKDIPSGCKEYAPNSSWLERKQIQVTLETHHSLVGSERIEKKANLSTAVWLSNVGKAKVTKKTGKIWEVFGHTFDSEDWLLPEEALFLLETNALELFRENVPLSIEETYTLVIGVHCTLDEYRVYSHLSRKGYKVLRHDKEITLTAYEKSIHLDQINLAVKRCAPTTSLTVSDEIREDKGRESQTGWEAEDEPKDTKSSADLSVAGKTKVVESTGEVEGESISTEEESIVAKESEHCSLPRDENGSKNGKSPSDFTVEKNAKDLDATCVPRVELISAGLNDQSPICIEDESKVVEGSMNESAGEYKSEDIDSTQEGSPVKAPAVVVEISLVDTIEKDCSSDVEMQDGHNLTVNAISSLKKRVGSSPDLYIVEDEEDEVIEIDDDEEHDAHEVEITDVKNASHMDTVDLMDSEEDDDVVFICQKDGNTDPTKWRKWFLNIPAFVNSTFPDEIDPSIQPPSKLKLIDLFDLGNRTIDTIMKAIPSHDGSAGFINAPDLRFIPQNIVPKYAHYRINVKTYDSAVDGSDTHSVQSHTPSTPVGHVDTSLSLSQVVQYGHEPANFSRNPYGYSFHRTRPNNYRRNPWNHQHSYQNRNNQFQRQNQSFRSNRFNSFDQNQDSRSLMASKDASNQNDFIRAGNHENQNRNYYTSNGSQNFGRPNNFRGSWNHSQNSIGNNLSAAMGGFQQNPNQFEGQLKHALQQACQLQMLAMSLMQNSQVLIQNCGAPSMFSNQTNFDAGNNFNLNNYNLANNFNPMNNFNSMNNVNPFMNQFSGDYRGRRPYRRPYMRRGSAGRRRFFNNGRGSPQVSEVPEVVCIDSDEEDRKIKPNKRMLALGAIATLNSNKRTKVIEITEVEDVKPARPVKNESQLSPYKLNTESTSVKNERLPTEAEPMDLGTVCNSEKATSAIPVSPDVDVCEVGPVIISKVLDRPSRSPLNMDDELTNSAAVEIVDDDASGTGSDSVVEVSSTNEPLTFERLNVPEDEGPELESVTEKDGNEESSTSKAEDVVTASDRSPVASVKEVLPGSWESYKQGLTEHDADTPSQFKTFSTLLSYDDHRAGVQDVLKSLQIFDTVDETETTPTRINVSFDVYLPNQPFRKSVRLLPNYRVIVTGSSCFPSVYELNYLEETYRDKVPFLYAVVYDDSIGLYNLHSATLPTLAESL